LISLTDDNLFLINKKFLKPTKHSRVLAILENLNADSCTSQHDMAKHTDLSGAMINKYLKELSTNGLIELKPLNGKSYSYEVTAGGEEQRAGLLGQYCAEIVQIYSALKKMIAAKLATLQAAGCTNLALFGASETCEVTIATLTNMDFRIMAIVDNDVQKQGTLFHGHIIHPPKILAAFDLHAVIITSFGRQQEIYEQLQTLVEKTNKPLQIIRL
jgi:predicted transcriptional regulator